MEDKKLYAIVVVAILAVAAFGTGAYALLSDKNGGSVPGVITDAAGNEIEVPDTINTITAASPSIADIVCYMGYGSKIVAVSTSCTHPDIPEGTPTVGSYSKPDTDGISTANADVTFIDGSSTTAVTTYNTLRAAGMTVVLLYGATDTVDGIYNNVEIVGTIMKNTSYKETVSSFKEEVSSLKNSTSTASKTITLLSTGLSTLATDGEGNFTNLDDFTGDGVYIAGKDAAVNSMAASVSNMTTPVSGSGWTKADTDFLSTSTGDVDLLIVLWTNKSSMPNESAIGQLIDKMKTTGWANCGAVDSGNIVFIGGDVGSDLSRVTPYTVYNGLPVLSLYINSGSYSKTQGGQALSFSDLPHCVDNTNLSTLVGYTENLPVAA